MSAAAAGRVGRFYTSARRHPWVLGKVADWKIPLGPYTPAQICVAVGGGFLLVKTVSWWSWMGPVPIAAWLVAVWAVRRPRIRGRAPLQAGLGWLLLVWQPRGGRIGGRAARDRPSSPLWGGFTIEDTPASPPGGPARAMGPSAGRAPARSRAAGRPPTRRRTPPAVPAAPAVPVMSVGPVSGMQHLLAVARAGGGR
ncbi:hypothetical protein [Streptomyces fructofermentans]|uniref:hypothetical protein n=1 Tax=Streptomyces fructofermentans TaxID=152141 RepID=UPI001673EBC6|nr:hypothetical protein [Streptomyces fructofermentans]